jgi:hypothetical protein
VLSVEFLVVFEKGWEVGTRPGISWGICCVCQRFVLSDENFNRIPKSFLRKFLTTRIISVGTAQRVAKRGREPMIFLLSRD